MDYQTYSKKEFYAHYLCYLNLASKEVDRKITRDLRIPASGHYANTRVKPRLACNVAGVNIYAVYKNHWCRDDEMNYHFSTSDESDTHYAQLFDVRDIRPDLDLMDVLLNHCIVDKFHLFYEKWLKAIEPVIVEGMQRGLVNCENSTPFLLKWNEANPSLYQQLVDGTN